MAISRLACKTESAASFYSIDGEEYMNSSQVQIISPQKCLPRGRRPSTFQEVAGIMLKNRHLSDEETCCWSDEGLKQPITPRIFNALNTHCGRKSIQSADSFTHDTCRIVTTDSADLYASTVEFADYSPIPLARKSNESFKLSRRPGCTVGKIVDQRLLGRKKANEHSICIPTSRMTIAELRERCLSAVSESQGTSNVLLCLDINSKIAPDDCLNTLGIKTKNMRNRSLRQCSKPLKNSEAACRTTASMVTDNANKFNSTGLPPQNADNRENSKASVASDTRTAESSWRRHASVPSVSVADILRKNEFKGAMNDIVFEQNAQNNIKQQILEPSIVDDMTPWGSLIFCGHCNGDHWTEETVSISPDEIQKKIDAMTPGLNWRWLNSIFCCWNPWP